ncbi:MAG TPA: hypothetical protein HA263_06250 [Methanoregulaceae archaeon]|nr:hypothetical protein [Methanoregulaceae archaeon]
MLVLASPGDETAIGVFDALRALAGGEAVRFVSGEQLALAPCWEHRLGEGRTLTRVRLADGTRLDSRWIGAVFNRLQAPLLPHFYSASEADRAYAGAETSALWLSWLASLPCRVVNPPSPGSLAGPWYPLPQWLHLAARAGLPARGYTFSTDPRVFREDGYRPFRMATTSSGSDEAGYEPVQAPPFARQPVCLFEPVDGPEETVLVAGERRVGGLKDRFPTELDQLRALAGCDLLRVSFARSSATGDLLVTGATSFPAVEDSESISAIASLVLEGMETAA